MKISIGAYVLWQKCLLKCSQKSSIASYVTLLMTVLFKQFKGDAPTVIAIISGTATILLFVLNDPQVKALLTGQKS